LGRTLGLAAKTCRDFLMEGSGTYPDRFFTKRIEVQARHGVLGFVPYKTRQDIVPGICASTGTRTFRRRERNQLAGTSRIINVCTMTWSLDGWTSTCMSVQTKDEPLDMRGSACVPFFRRREQDRKKMRGRNGCAISNLACQWRKPKFLRQSKRPCFLLLLCLLVTI
jgi:hypothetical protein